MIEIVLPSINIPESVIVLFEALIKALIFVIYLLTSAALTVWFERRVAGIAQDRLGPNRTGPFGLLQPFSDVFKLFFKEDFVPANADRFTHALAPCICVFVATMLYTVVPLGHYVTLNGRDIYLGVAPNLNIGILVVLAMTSFGVYGFMLAGWSSGNKYSLLGGLRSSAQMISYELAMGMSVVGVVMVTGSMGTNDIILHQSDWHWNVILQPLGFLIYFITALAEINHTPFDFPEAEQELVAGYNTEYSSMRFGMFYLSEYANVAASSVIIVILFFGGWQIPYLQEFTGLEDGSVLLALIQIGTTILKVIFFIFLIIWIRWTLPRFRYDQLMHLGWYVLLPLSLINLVVTACVIYFLL
ncbi:MAG: NADH-quinone oxidoreductase subunit NuoH [Ignavibacteria bacterium]|jgi:NADH-quinone oxidoreductase subunit H|nr:NADH-quinone oxidoreductase subunit NuoH [Ignavibacteria bacterium]